MTRVLSHKAPAKINLYLHVTGRREDGYHLLDSLVVFANDLADDITVTESNDFSFGVSGPYAGALAAEDQERNLCVRAARLYAEAIGAAPHFKIHLEKHLPAGAGIGGGSADAAAVIRALEEFHGQPLPTRDPRLAMLGADVPVCYRSHACRFKGIGDIIRDVPPIPPFHILLVWPDRHSATKGVFAAQEWAYQRPVEYPPSFGTLEQFVSFLRNTKNDLYVPAARLTPEITQAVEAIESQGQCLLARMSGSGSAAFGLFADAAGCQAAERHIARRYPGWWVKSAFIG